LGNSGNQTYVGQNGQTFQFTLPPNIQDVSFQDDNAGTRFVESAGGYADTAPIIPGDERHSIVAVYSLPYADNLTVDIPLPADISSTSVVMQDQGAKLQSDQLQFVENRDFQGGTFAIYSGANLKKGDKLTLQLTNLDNLTFASEPAAPEATVAGSNLPQEGWLWLILGLGAVVIVGVAVGYPHLHPRLSQPEEAVVEDPQLRRQKLLVLLARLDELFETGQLDKQLYHRARARYKSELVQLMEG
jgi:hypothetical protein